MAFGMNNFSHKQETVLWRSDMHPHPSTFSAWILVLAGGVPASMSLCNFSFGVDLEQHAIKACGKLGCIGTNDSLKISQAETDFLALPIGYADCGTDVQLAPKPCSGREGFQLNMCNDFMLTPVWYSSIIAEGAKQKLGIPECDSMGIGVCSLGAQYIRDNRVLIINQYKAYAAYAANYNNWGTSRPIVIVLDRNFYQYTSSKQKNPLSYFEASLLLSDIANAIQTILPKALISADIASGADDLWWSQTMPYSQIELMSTSGGASLPSDTIHRGDSLTWQKMWSFAKKGMIADDGYATGGVPNPNWLNADNLNLRIADGLIGLTEAIGDTAWESKVQTIRPQLHQLKTCNLPAPKQFTVSLMPGTGGSIQMNLAQLTGYDSATNIQFQAVPQTGYRFVSWGGDLSGTLSSASLVLTKNSTISATFASTVPKKCTLTVVQPATGSITWVPNQTIFDSGTTVTMTAHPPVGSTFSTWTGFSSSVTNPLVFAMTSTRSIGVSFSATPPKQCTLTVIQPTTGSITWVPNQTVFDSGTTVTVTAHPAVGSAFLAWTGFSSSVTNPLVFAMTSTRSIGVSFKTTGILPRQLITSFAMQSRPSSLSLQMPTEAGPLVAEIIGMDGITEAVLANASVQAGSFQATYSLRGIRPGLHVLRVVNGNREFRETVTILH